MQFCLEVQTRTDAVQCQSTQGLMSESPHTPRQLSQSAMYGTRFGVSRWSQLDSLRLAMNQLLLNMVRYYLHQSCSHEPVQLAARNKVAARHCACVITQTL